MQIQCKVESLCHDVYVVAGTCKVYSTGYLGGRAEPVGISHRRIRSDVETRDSSMVYDSFGLGSQSQCGLLCRQSLC